MSRRIAAASTSEASGRLNSSPPLAERLVEEIADRRAQWPGQDERRPEQSDAADPVQK